MRGPTCAVAVVLVLTACDGTDDPTPDQSPAAASPAASSVAPAADDGGTIVLRQDGCRLEPGPSPLRAGPVTFDVQNRTGGLGAANIALLDGVSFSRFERHIRKEIRLALADEPVLGHPPFAVPIVDVVVEPGTTARLESDLDPGTYVLACAGTYGRADDLRPSGALGPVVVTG
jgi:hypothetical protein